MRWPIHSPFNISSPHQFAFPRGYRPSPRVPSHPAWKSTTPLPYSSSATSHSHPAPKTQTQATDYQHNWVDDAETLARYRPPPIRPLELGIDAGEFSLADAHLILGDFGEVSSRPPRCPPPRPTSGVWAWPSGRFLGGLKAPSSVVEVGTAEELVAQGAPKQDRDIWPPIDQEFEDRVQHYRRKRKIGEFGAEETAAILDLMRRMLAFRPEEQPVDSGGTAIGVDD
ncbi:hypothetical protein BO99DRAFT_444659 [Aspergillus violaceofuscus CBS 115571]|uniref:Uncharacterized protein n=2 Tax=Aspergillus TaxID=5052 RepID=A0A2V5H0Q9_ASPV1|nr:hypothetical protein BO99DRAFT_444659 [Aspergillus violaceofuscus CBS 115571]